MILTVITPTIRPASALRAAESIRVAAERARDVDVRHVIAHWTREPDPSRRAVAPWLTGLIRESAPGWVCFVDDDNLMHPSFVDALAQAERDYPAALAFAFGQRRTDFGGLLAATLPPVPGQIDGGQVALWRDYATREPWRPGDCGDGEYLAALYAHDPARWVAIPQALTYHNAQRWL
jgi:hypothetical protein